MTRKNEIAKEIRDRIRGREDAPKAAKLLRAADMIENATDKEWNESFYDVKDANGFVSAIKFSCGRLAEKIQTEVFGW